MKRIIAFILGILAVPAIVGATPVSWDYTSNILRPLQSMWTKEVRVPYLTATSTTATSTFVSATTSRFAIGNTLRAFGLTGTAWSDFCTAITGSADLCDGSDGGGGSNWLYTNGALTPSTTVPINVDATTTTDTLIVGGYGTTLQAGITTPAAFINASTTSRSGMILQNYGTGTAPEYRFIVGDPYMPLEYLAFGLTNRGATTPGALFGLNKNEIGYLITNSTRDLLISTAASTENVYIGANSNGIRPQLKIDGSNGYVGINIATSTVPSYQLHVVGDIGAANITATGTVTTVNSTTTNATTTNLIALTRLALPYAASHTFLRNGDIAIDSTSNQVKYQSNSSTYVLGNGNFYPSFTYSTSTAWTGTTTIPLGTAFIAETWNAIQCFTDAGSTTVQFGDGTNWMNLIVASTTVGTTAMSSNNTFTAQEKRYVRMGSPQNSPTTVSCTVSKSYTAD